MTQRIKGRFIYCRRHRGGMEPKTGATKSETRENALHSAVIELSALMLRPTLAPEVRSVLVRIALLLERAEEGA